MAYRWTPSASQRKAFAQRMQDPAAAAAYEQRKRDRAAKRRSTSQYNYESAGGSYIPTSAQYDAALIMLGRDLTQEQELAANQVLYGYTCQERVHHDYIHLINEFRRATPEVL